MAEIVERIGGDVKLLERSWESSFTQEDIIEEIEKANPDIVALVHGETANGQYQNIDRIGQVCKDKDILFFVDAVATLGGMDFQQDNWNVDISQISRYWSDERLNHHTAPTHMLYALYEGLRLFHKGKVGKIYLIGINKMPGP